VSCCLRLVLMMCVVPPKIMGVGPAYAIPKALSNAGIELSDVDFFEINEAFASQAVMSIQHLGIPIEKVNPKYVLPSFSRIITNNRVYSGGAIAMGHPLGCSTSLSSLIPDQC
jgi:acetyl-CoA acyltransferase 1